MSSTDTGTSIHDLLGSEADSLLNHSAVLDKSMLNLPGPDVVGSHFASSDRSPQVLRSLQAIYGHGRLANTGYVSILPVDQGIEHSAAASFSKNPAYFDADNIIRLAVEGGCNAVATTYGVLGSVARKWVHKIPFIVKINHNELMTSPNSYDQVLFGSVQEAWNLGASAVGATIYFGSDQSRRQIQEIADAFAFAMNSVWRPSCGATCEATISRSGAPTTTLQPI